MLDNKPYRKPWAESRGFWNDGKVDRLQGLAADNSAQDIADIISQEFACECSRNAVIGKLHRLGISCGNIGERIRRGKGKFGAKMKPKPKSKPRPRPGSMPQLFLQAWDLDNETCRWPIGTPWVECPTCREVVFAYCGRREADLSENRPYCAEHTRRALPVARR